MPDPAGQPPPSSHTLWRAFVPRWAYMPLSGEGAARFGGRWNPVGQPTIGSAAGHVFALAAVTLLFVFLARRRLARNA